MTDIHKMKGQFESPIIEGDVAILRSTFPVVNMKDYHKEVIAYTSGFVKLNCIPGDYDECHNLE